MWQKTKQFKLIIAFMLSASVLGALSINLTRKMYFGLLHLDKKEESTEKRKLWPHGGTDVKATISIIMNDLV